MGPAVYALSTLTTLCCAVLLIRAWSRVGQRLLLWSGLCFAALTVSNFLVFADLVLFPDINLYRFRLATAALAMLLLLYGLIWESE